MFFLSSCATLDHNETYSLQIITVDKNKNLINAECKLFSSTTNRIVDTPTKINFQASCAPINVFCKKGTLNGEHGIIPRIEPHNTADLLISSGLGAVFDRVVDATTPFGLFVRYARSDDETCLLPKKITVVLE
tara:strand:+ start:115 stop:513 length:399 start_codon:yes stop_codon:yes gene_type:complete